MYYRITKESYAGQTTYFYDHRDRRHLSCDRFGRSNSIFFKKDLPHKVQQIIFGFAAGIMTAAAVFSLILPAIEQLESEGKNILLPIGGGFVLGCLFLFLFDRLLPHLHTPSAEPEGHPVHWKKSTMLVFAVTLHNIPEGMTVGLAFAAAALGNGTGALLSAIALAVGMGLQNFPEGAAVSLPLRSAGVSKGKAFACGALSGIVEPIFGIIAVLLASIITGIMPWALSFAAGAMLYVVLDELVPEAYGGEHSHLGTASILLGFFIMMILDVTIG